VTDYLQRLIDRGKMQATFIERVIYPMYQAAQQDRWASQNATQGSNWEPLNSKQYATYKLKKFGKYPGAGKVLMIATGKLFGSVRGPGEDFSRFQKSSGGESASAGFEYHNKIITPSYMQIFTSLPYAKYPGVTRPFMTFKQDTLDEWVAKFRDWLDSGHE
jgi:hypothetical protein